MEEVWKDIENYEGLYQVNNFGQVRSVKRNIILKGWSVKGYICVPLNKNGKQEDARVHRLVARAFIPNPDNYFCVDHINGNRTDNRANNLRWCTTKQNNGFAMARRNKSISKQGENNPFYGVFGADHCSSKKVQQLTLDGSIIKEWSSAAEASRELGIQFSNISRCCHGRSKSAGGFIWKFMTQE